MRGSSALFRKFAGPEYGLRLHGARFQSFAESLKSPGMVPNEFGSFVIRHRISARLSVGRPCRENFVYRFDEAMGYCDNGTFMPQAGLLSLIILLKFRLFLP